MNYSLAISPPPAVAVSFWFLVLVPVASGIRMSASFFPTTTSPNHIFSRSCQVTSYILTPFRIMIRFDFCGILILLYLVVFFSREIFYFHSFMGILLEHK